MYDIVISIEQNNSLGSCWLFKLEETYGELVDKTLYPRSDYSGQEAFERFLDAQGLVLEDIESITNMAEGFDPALDTITHSFTLFGVSPRYAVEYRDMHSALHVLAVYGSEVEADQAYGDYSSGDDYAVAGALGRSQEFVEINFRDVDQDAVSGQWYWGDGDRAFIIVNPGHQIPDVG